jgi:hypothetical protein
MHEMYAAGRKIIKNTSGSSTVGLSDKFLKSRQLMASYLICKVSKMNFNLICGLSFTLQS